MKIHSQVRHFSRSIVLGLTLALVSLWALNGISTPVIYAANITVNGLADDIDDDGECTLREAIIAANTDTASGVTANECIAGSGDDTIGIVVSGTIVLSNTLPDISSNIVINGPGATDLTIDGNNRVRVLKIIDGDVTISGISIANGFVDDADGGHGGGILNTSSGTVTIVDSVVINNQANGANGAANGVAGCCYGGGGGIYHETSGTLNIFLTVIQSNTVIGGDGANAARGAGGGGGGGAFGGGLFGEGGPISISATTFLGNRVIGGNGGNATPCGSTFMGGGGGGGQANGLGGGGQGAHNGGGSGHDGNFGGGGGGPESVNPPPSPGNGGFGGGQGGISVSGCGGAGGGGAGIGGGIFNNNSTINITNSTFVGNQVLGGNGGTNGSALGDNGQGLNVDIFNWAELTLVNTPIVNSPPTLSNYMPAHNTPNRPLNQQLSWSADDSDGDYLSYNIAFGSNPGALTELEDVNSPLSPPVALDYETTYYWVVTATDGISITSSGLLSFTTFRKDYYVDALSGNNATGNGRIASPWKTISYALSQVAGPDVEIHVAPGTYDQALGESYPLIMEPGVSLVGAGYTSTTISGNGSTYAIHFPSTAIYTEATVISGFKIMNGTAGIRVDGAVGSGASPTIRANWITENTNGIENHVGVSRYAYTVIEDNLIANNTNYGIRDNAEADWAQAKPNITHNRIVNNGSGGIYCASRASNYYTANCSPVIMNNVISDNSGDGLTCHTSYAGSCNPELINNTISGNQGWGVRRSQGFNYNVLSAPRLINNLIYDNADGGAYFVFYFNDWRIDKPLLLNNTIAYNNLYGVRSGLPTIKNSIVWGHTDDLDVAVSYVSYSNIGDGEYGSTNQNISTDPQFVDPTYGDYHVLPTSPVLNAGDSSHADLTTLDIDGDPRILGASVGIGADETQPYSLLINKSVAAIGDIGVGDRLTYTLTVTNLSPFSAGGTLVTDTLPPTLNLVELGQPETGWSSVDSETITWLSTLPKNSSQSLTFTAGLTEIVYPRIVTNTAQISNRTGGITTTGPVTTSVAAVVVWDTSSHRVNRAIAHPGEKLVYTLTLTNSGNVEATGVVVTNTLASLVSFDSAGSGGIFDGTNIVWNGLTVPIDAQLLLTVTATISPSIPHETALVNQALVSSASQSFFPLPGHDATTVVYNPVQANFNGISLTGVAPHAVNFTNTSLYATNYVWDFGDGSPTSSITNPTHIYQNGGVYTVTLQASNPRGSDTRLRSAYVTIYDPPQASFAAMPTVGLAPFTTTLTNNSQNADSYLWDYGDGFTGTTTALTHTHIYINAGSYTVRLTASNPYSDAMNTQPDYITVYNPPLANFDTIPQSGLEPLVVNFSNSSTNANFYLWSFGDGSISYAANPSHVYLESGVYTVTLTASNPAGGDTLIRSELITVHGIPTADFEATPTVGLSPLGVTFTNNSQKADSYVWDYGDGLMSITPLPSHMYTYTNPGIYTVVLTASNAYATDARTRTSYIAVYDPPIASFSGTPQVGTNPLQVNFNSFSINATSYLWDFGDGNNSTEENPSHTYQNGGSYTVVLTASNPAADDTLIRPAYVTVHQVPTADFEASPTLGFSPLAVTFTNSSQHADSYTWDYGDGSSSTAATISHTHIYSTPGIYSVTLTATNVHSQVAKTRAAYIQVYPTPSPHFDATPSLGAVPLNVTFSNNSTNADSYLWDFGDGNTSSVISPTHLYNSIGQYTVTLTASNPAGAHTFTQTVIVYTMPQAHFVAIPTIGLAPLTVNLSNSSSYADGYEWSYGDGITSTVVAGHNHIYSTPGVYTVSLKAMNAFTYDLDLKPGHIIVYGSLLTDFYVDAINGSDISGDGTQSAPWRTINRALSLVGGPGVTIHLAPGVYNEALGETFPIILQSGTKIIGAGSELVTIAGDNAQPVFRFPDTVQYNNDTLVESVRISGGFIGVQIYGSNSSGSTITLSDTIISGNQTGVYLYAISSKRSYVYINQSDVSNNLGIGINTENLHQGHGTLNLEHSEVTNNSSYGIRSYIYGPGSASNSAYSTVTIDNSLIADNGSDGILSTGQFFGRNQVECTNSTLQNNTGTGLRIDILEWNTEFTDNLNNCIVANNVGGGVFLTQFANSKVTSSILNSTIVYNNNYGVSFQPTSYGNIDIANSIIWGHMDNLTGVPIADVTYSDVEDTDYSGGNDNISVYPQFINPGGQDYHLLSTSPAIDIGDNSNPNLSSVDIDGDPRILGGVVDMGADEFDPFITGLSLDTSSPTVLGQQTFFTATVTSNSNTTYTWEFGDGTTGSGATLSHLYSTVGTYTAVVTASNGANIVTTTTPVTITDEALSGLSVTQDSPTPLGQLTTLTATVSSGSNVSYAWDFGDGTAGSGASTPHLYPAIGTYTASVTVTNSTNIVTTSTVVTIVNPPITGLSITTDSPTPLAHPTHLTATVASGGGISYTWSFGDGTFGSGEATAHTYPFVGSYTVIVTASNETNVMTASTAVTITAMVPPGVDVNVTLIGGGTITIPTNTFTDTVTLIYTPHPITNTGDLNHVGLFYTLDAIYPNGDPAQPQPGQRYTITLAYQQADVPPGINEADLALYFWDGAAWIKEESSVVDPEANTITATPDHFSLWAILTRNSPEEKIYVPIILKAQ